MGKGKANKPSILILVLGIILLTGAQILTANRLATWGVVLERYQRETNWFLEENQRLENKILFLSSLGRIASDSARLAFQKQRIIYLPYPVTVAMREE